MPAADARTGGCLCGEVRYEFRGPPLTSIVCHCRMCQKASGAPFVALFYVDRGGVAVTKGHPAAYRSSPEVTRRFCARCGSPVFFERSTRPDRIAIMAGSLDDPDAFEPELQVCASSAVGWPARLGNVPGHAEKPAGMSPALRYDPRTGEAVPD
jgi:hypothetical protein